MYNSRKKIGIPKIIHQIWLGRKPRPVELMESCKKMHQDYTYKLWNDENIEQLLPMWIYKSHHKEYAKSAPMRAADILRYQALYFYGGIYIDADSKCIQPMTPIIENMKGKECFAGYEHEALRPGLIANGVIGCTQYSITMLMMLHRMQYARWDKPTWAAVGPLLLTETYQMYNISLAILPSATFYPYHNEDKIDEKESKAINSYTVQYWGSTHDAY